MALHRSLQVLAITSLASCAAFAQSVISAQSGLIHYYEGEVLLQSKMLETKAGEFPQIKPQQVVETQLGRVEIILTPGTTLRLGENSAIRLISGRLESTQVEFLRGSALIEVVEPMQNDELTFRYQGSNVPLNKNGLYRFDSAPARFATYVGEAVVDQRGQTYTVGAGKSLSFGTMLVERFDAKRGDALVRWAKRRSEQLAMANISSARSLIGAGRVTSGWFYNQYLGMMTFVPYSGRYMSPFGWSFYSPFVVDQYLWSYRQPPVTGFRQTMPNLGNWPGGDNSVHDSLVSGRTVETYRSPNVGMMPTNSGAGISAPSTPAASSVSSPRGSDSGSGIAGGGGHSGGGRGN